MATESIILDGQKLTGEDHYGKWKVTSDMDDWWSSPDPKGEQVARENADGDFDLPVDYESRYITIGGSLRTKGHEQLHLAMNRFAGLVRRRSRLLVVGHGATQWANVVRASSLKMVPVTDTYAQWQVRLKAPDPRKYGDTATFTRTNGTVEVFHRGNFDAHPTIVVRGSAANGYRINGPGGKQYKVSRALVAGTPHRIEFNDGLLRVDGNLTPTGVDRADVWPVPPGQPISFDINVLSGGTAEASITVTDTYI